MLKKCILLFVLIFTVQLGWAVASAYCLHETDKAAQHFGHHPHQHQADNPGDSNGTDKSPNKKTQVHADCAACVYATVGACPTNSALRLSPAPGYQLGADLPAPSSAFVAQPERPKWQVFA